MFSRTRPLYVNVIDRAIASATQDSRFPQVKYSELKGIKIEISVLTEPKPMEFSSPEDLLAKLRPLKDGVILETRYGESTFLPQVWEQLPEKEAFLGHLCMKHGAPADTWKRDYKNLKVLVYEAVVFGEEDYGRKTAGKKGAVVGKGGATVVGYADLKKEAGNKGPAKAAEGTVLEPGTIVTQESDIADRQ
jgi:AmmeMemoRadiSam system protein A